jgi:tetratricopeptide (TPR) repeat protein
MLERGLIYQDAASHDLAIRDFTTAIELDLAFDLAYFYRAKSYLALKQTEQAITDFELSINHCSKFCVSNPLRGGTSPCENR